MPELPNSVHSDAELEAEAVQPVVERIVAPGGRIVVIGHDNRGTINMAPVINVLTNVPRFVPVAVAVLLLVGVGVYAAGPAVVQARLQEVWERYLPWPTRMTGQFNIVLAEIGTVDDQGRVMPWADGRDIERQLYDDVVADLARVAQDDPSGGLVRARISGLQVRPPAWTPPLSGATTAEQTRSAEDLATRLNADVVLYGNVKIDPASGLASFLPQFFVSTRRLGNASGLIGQYELGSEMRGLGDPKGLNLRVGLEERMRARVRALPFLVTGLAFYADNQLKDAAEFFAAAQNTTGWSDVDGGAAVSDGKELVYVLQGNTAGRLGDLDAAGDFYARALDARPGYSRALLGKAEVQFSLAQRGCQAGQADTVGLQQALADYQEALAGPLQPPNSDVPTKTAFGTGRVHLCLSEAGQGDYWINARDEFTVVTDDFRSGNERVRELAAEAYADLGWIYLRAPLYAPGTDASYRLAADGYRTASDLSQRPAARATYFRTLGFIYRRLRQDHDAQAAYDHADNDYVTAIELDPANRDLYARQRADLRTERSGA